MAGSTTSLAAQITAHLASKSLQPTSAWLSGFLSTQRPTTPLAALKSTAYFRLCASDFTESLQSSASSTFPSDILNGDMRERTLPGPIPVQLLSIEDIGRSRWSQIEAIEAAERGETTKGREIIRVVPGEEGLSDPDASSNGPHKLLLQDSKGVQVFAFDVSPIDGIGLATNMGVKLLLTNASVARGVLLLEPASVTLLGGRIDAMHKAWKDSRKARLLEGIDDGAAAG